MLRGQNDEFNIENQYQVYNYVPFIITDCTDSILLQGTEWCINWNPDWFYKKHVKIHVMSEKLCCSFSSIIFNDNLFVQAQIMHI